MGNTGSMTSADELNEQYDADGSVTQVPERNDEVHAGARFKGLIWGLPEVYLRFEGLMVK